METATTLATSPITDAEEAVRERHFALELLALIMKVMATALAFNIVVAGFIVLLASRADAAPAQVETATTARAVHELPPGREDRSAAQLSPRDAELALLHRLHSRPRLPLPTPGS